MTESGVSDEFTTKCDPKPEQIEIRGNTVKQSFSPIAQVLSDATPQMAKEVLHPSADRLIEESKMPLKPKGADTQPITSPMRPLDPLSASSQDQGQEEISIRDDTLFMGRNLEDFEASKI